jgi:hypothetical protein
MSWATSTAPAGSRGNVAILQGGAETVRVAGFRQQCLGGHRVESDPDRRVVTSEQAERKELIRGAGTLRVEVVHQPLPVDRHGDGLANLLVVEGRVGVYPEMKMPNASRQAAGRDQPYRGDVVRALSAVRRAGLSSINLGPQRSAGTTVGLTAGSPVVIKPAERRSASVQESSL